MRRSLYALVLFLLAISPVFSGLVYAAGTAKLYLSPDSADVSQNSSLTVSIRVNSGSEQINVVQANLSYPADKLDFVTITNSSAFSIPVGEDQGGNGSVRIGRGSLMPVSGDQLVASVEFKVKAVDGSASITFAAGSAVKKADGQGTDILGETQGGTYMIKVDQTPPPTSPPQDIVKPIIKNVKVTKITTRGASVSWQTSELATSEIHYGLNTKYGLTVADDDLTTNHELVLDSALLRPDTKYHYRIKSVDAAGNETYSPDRSFTTQAATDSTNSSSDLPQPAIFNSQPRPPASPNPLLLTLGLASLAISGGLLLLSIKRYNKRTILSIDRLLVSTLSKQHNKILKRLLRS